MQWELLDFKVSCNSFSYSCSSYSFSSNYRLKYLTCISLPSINAPCIIAIIDEQEEAQHDDLCSSLRYHHLGVDRCRLRLWTRVACVDPTISPVPTRTDDPAQPPLESDFWYPSPLQPGQVEPLRWRHDNKTVCPYTLAVGLPPILRETLLKFAEQKGIVKDVSQCPL